MELNESQPVEKPHSIREFTAQSCGYSAPYSETAMEDLKMIIESMRVDTSGRFMIDVALTPLI